MKHCLIFHVKFFYATIVLCLSILRLKAVNEITAWQARTSFVKVIKVCGIKYLTTQIELVLPTFKSWTVHKIIEYLTLKLLTSLWNIYHSITAYFLTHPVKHRQQYSMQKITIFYTDRWCFKTFFLNFKIFQNSKHHFPVLFILPNRLTYVASLHAWHSTRSLKLSNTNLPSAPFVRTSFGARSFSVAVPKIWHSLPLSLRTCTSPDTFRRHLKTHYCQ